MRWENTKYSFLAPGFLAEEAVYTYSEKFADHLYEKLPKALKKFEDMEKEICR